VFLGPDLAQTKLVALVGPRNNDTITTEGELTLPMAEWATMTAWSNRVAAAVPSATGLTLTVAQLDTGVLTVDGTGIVGSHAESGALARLRSHLFVAQGYSGGIKVLRLESADAVLGLVPVASIDMTPTNSAPPLSNFDGTHLAVAAARQRVALVWTTKSDLANGDPTGGWALLRCPE
jgi:hypothetical protein